MLKNYFKIALRKLAKNRLYAIVNIGGLSIGIISCLFIGVYILHELSFDRFQHNAGRIVRLTTERRSAGNLQQYAETPTKAGPVIKQQLSEVQEYVRTIKSAAVASAGPERTFDEKNVLFADAPFFSVFSFPLISGNAATVLDAPNKLVLTRTAATRYFGSTDIAGKSLRIGSRDYAVTGVCEDAPANSQIQFSMVASFATLPAYQREVWSEANYITYLLLTPHANIAALEQREIGFMKSAPTRESYQATGNDYLIYHFEPLLRVHLHSPYAGLEPNTNSTYIYILGIIALLILVIACVNYTNLAVAQSASRSIEIGIRKVLGADRQVLFSQFIGEAGVLVLIATLLSVLACVLLLPAFNQVTGKHFTVSDFFRPSTLLLVTAFGVLVSFIAGAYPAVVLSGTGIASVLKSGVHLSSSGGGLRKTLIVFQFVVSIFLIVATVVILQQLSFIRHRDIGYDKDQVMVIPIDGKTRAQYKSIKQELEASPLVRSVSGAYETPVFVRWGDYAQRSDANTGDKKLAVNAMPVQMDFIKTMGMRLIAGTDFSEADLALMDTADNYKNYRHVYILNETAARNFGWTPQDAIGQTIEKGAPGVVKGVIKDFNYSSAHEPVGNMVLFADTSQTREMYVKLNGKNIPRALSFIGGIWKERVPHRPFNYRFLDDDYNALYTNEQRSAQLFSAFSFIAVLLASMGLFALAAYATVRRTKEIGIRKVLGANMLQVVGLIAQEFLQLVIIAIVVASPLAWFAAHRWLEDFAYRINIQVWVFAGAGMAALAITLLTVSFHAIKAGLMNPVKALRTE